MLDDLKNKIKPYYVITYRNNIGGGESSAIYDFNTASEMGYYNVYPTTNIQHDPRTIKHYDMMLVYGSFITQFLISISDKKIYIRKYVGDQWHQWYSAELNLA